MKTKWGIIGTGNIAHALADALIKSDDNELVAVGSRKLETANQFKEKYQAKRAYGSYEALVKDDEVDVIYIATPHRYHKENAILCIENNKSILCEKPFTVNSKDAKEVYALAKEKGVFIMEAMWTKFNPTVKKVMEWIHSGKIGDVRLVQANFCFNSAFDPNSRIFNAELAGGSLLDVGIYPITFTTMIFGLEPKDVQSNAYIGKTNVDEQATYLFNYGEGKQAILSSAVSVTTPFDAWVYGTKGRIYIPNFFMAQEATLFVGDHQEKYEHKFRVNGYEYEVDEVNYCLKNGLLESNVVPMKDTIKILELMDSIRQDWNFKYPFE